MLSLDERRNYRVIKSRYAESRGSYEIFSRIAEGGLWEKRTNICHTPDERLLELKENVQNEDGGINMCGAVDQMIAEGMERGMERGLAQGMERGLAQGTERGIKNLIEVCQELGTSYDNVQFQVEMKYNLSQEEAERYMKQYWK